MGRRRLLRLVGGSARPFAGSATPVAHLHPIHRAIMTQAGRILMIELGPKLEP
jgi:hypothetical protein